MNTKRADGRELGHAQAADERAQELRTAVEAVMARLAEGDDDALWDLHVVAERALTRILRAEARRLDVRIGDEDLYDLTLDAVTIFRKLARAWKPGGALPWVWARPRVTALVHEHVGTFARPLDETHLDIEQRPVIPPIDDPREVLRSLSRRHPAARLLEEQLDAVASERDADVWLGVLLEKAAGNRSPAVTVGVDHDLLPATVRKVVQRINERLDAA